MKQYISKAIAWLMLLVAEKESLYMALLRILPEKSKAEQIKVFQYRFKKLCMGSDVDAAALIHKGERQFGICGDVDGVSLRTLTRAFAVLAASSNSTNAQDKSKGRIISGI